MGKYNRRWIAILRPLPALLCSLTVFLVPSFGNTEELPSRRQYEDCDAGPNHGAGIVVAAGKGGCSPRLK